MIKLFNILSLVIVFVAFSSCGKESSCLKSSGTIITELRSVSTSITKVNIENNINLILTQSTDADLKVEAGDNLLPYVKTVLNGNTLEISNGNKCNFLRSYDKPINVYLSLPNLTEINYSGKGTVTNVGVLKYQKLTIESKSGTGNINLNLESDNVRLLSHSGATEFTIKGSTNKLFIYSGSSTWCYLFGFSAKEVQVNNAGVGDVHVHAIDKLLIELGGTGNIVYTGNPVVTIGFHTGSGQLIKK